MLISMVGGGGEGGGGVVVINPARFLKRACAQCPPTRQAEKLWILTLGGINERLILRFLYVRSTGGPHN
jgi:hypothetical protein